MQFPFKIIESSISRRNQFDVVDGYQPTHALFYLKKGSFDIEIEGEMLTVKEGDCLILPDYLHFRRSVIRPIEFVFVKFTNNLTCPYSLHIPYGKVTWRDDRRMSANIAAIEQLIARDDALSVAYREHLLQDMLFDISFHLTPSGNAGQQVLQSTLVTAATSYIEAHLRDKLHVEDICRAIGSNSSTLHFHFRRELGMSVGQYLTSQRMKRARELLLGTNYSISEIATRCGFENIYYFSNAFKKAHDIAPREYRDG